MLKIKNIEDRFLHNMSATGTFMLWRFFIFKILKIKFSIIWVKD